MGNKNTKNFVYDDFLKLMKPINKQEQASQQLLLQQYKCMMLNHKDKQIEGMCVNETCKQQNRRICFDCTNDRIHDQDHGKMALIKNADQLENMIQEFKFLLNQKMDDCQFQLYFEQLEFCDESNDTLAYIKFKELIKIEEKIQSQLQKLDKLNFKSYVDEQSLNNVGLFQYLQDYQQLINIIYQLLNGYKQMKNEIKQKPKKFLQSLQVDKNNLEEMQIIRKKKISIIDIIQKSNQLKNDKITKDQKLYLIKNIEELNNTIYQQKQEILAINNMILFQIGPKDANYYYKKFLDLESNNQYEQAIHMLDQAKKLDPNNQWYYFSKAPVLEKMEKYEQAILMYDQAIKLYPKDGWIYARKASALKKMEKYEQAILIYDQAIQLDPKNGQNYIKQASALKKMKKYEQALLVYHQAIYQLDPKDGLYQIRKGILCTKNQTNK